MGYAAQHEFPGWILEAVGISSYQAELTQHYGIFQLRKVCIEFRDEQRVVSWQCGYKLRIYSEIIFGPMAGAAAAPESVVE